MRRKLSDRAGGFFPLGDLVGGCERVEWRTGRCTLPFGSEGWARLGPAHQHNERKHEIYHGANKLGRSVSSDVAMQDLHAVERCSHLRSCGDQQAREWIGWKGELECCCFTVP